MTKKMIDNKCDGRTKNHWKGKMKIEISKIENEIQKKVTFSKRRTILFKKALQYKPIIGANIAVIAIFSFGHLYSTDDDGNTVDAVVDEYLKLVNKEKDADVDAGAGNKRKVESKNETRILIERILKGMIENTGNDSSIETLLEMKARLEMIKKKADNRLMGSCSTNENSFENVYV